MRNEAVMIGKRSITIKLYVCLLHSINRTIVLNHTNSCDGIHDTLAEDYILCALILLLKEKHAFSVTSHMNYYYPDNIIFFHFYMHGHTYLFFNCPVF